MLTYLHTVMVRIVLHSVIITKTQRKNALYYTHVRKPGPQLKVNTYPNNNGTYIDTY